MDASDPTVLDRRQSAADSDAGPEADQLVSGSHMERW